MDGKFSYFVCKQSDVVREGDAIRVDIPSGSEVISVVLTRHAARGLQIKIERALDGPADNIITVEAWSDHG